MKIDGCQVHPNTVLTHPYFVVIRDRLCRPNRDVRTGEEFTQLLVPKSRRETIFQAAHHNPMAGHLGYDKTLIWIMARFYWQGIRTDVSQWCASCREYQLVNPAATPKALLLPLPLIEVQFKRIAMDLVGPLDRSALGFCFVLVQVDYATHYPKVVPLRNISAKSVGGIFSF